MKLDNHNRRLQQGGLFALVAILIGAASVRANEEDHISVTGLVVKVIDAVDVASPLAGIVAEVAIKEGDNVTRDQLFASLDNKRAAIQLALAQTQLDVIQQRALADSGVELAAKRLSEQRQLAAKHSVERAIANEKAANGVRVSAARKAEAVAKNELDRALHARQQYSGAISSSEIDALRLTHEKSKLESEQAVVDSRLDQLLAKVESEAAMGFQLAIERAELELAQAEAEKISTALQIKLQEQQRELAALHLSSHLLRSPLDGVVVAIERRTGDWVDEGETVLRVIHLDRLRVEGFVPFSQLAKLRSLKSVTLTIHVSPTESIQRIGEVTFIHPELDPVNQQIGFWVEFENSQRDVLPGMYLDLSSADLQSESLSKKGSDPLRRGKIANEIDSETKSLTPFRVGTK